MGGTKRGSSAKPRVVYLTETDQAAWSRDHAAGLVPSQFVYGAEELSTLGLELDIMGYPRPKRGRLRQLDNRLADRLGLRPYPALTWLSHAARADLVVAALEHAAAAPALLRHRGVFPWSHVPLVALTCWLSEEARQGDAAERARLLHRFDGVDQFIVLSRNQFPILEELGISRDRLMWAPYGVDTTFFDADPGGERDIDILTVGRDWGRDYDVLFEAVAGTDLVVDVVCPIDQLPNPRPELNLRLHGRVPPRTYAAMLARAKVVVVPTKEFAYPTGQSVALEASAAGCCLVASGTIPLREYLADGETALLVPPGDVESLRVAVQRALADPELRLMLGRAAQARVRAEYSTHAMWSTVVQQLRKRGYLPGTATNQGQTVSLTPSRSFKL